MDFLSVLLKRAQSIILYIKVYVQNQNWVISFDSSLGKIQKWISGQLWAITSVYVCVCALEKVASVQKFLHGLLPCKVSNFLLLFLWFCYQEVLWDTPHIFHDMSIKGLLILYLVCKESDSLSCSDTKVKRPNEFQVDWKGRWWPLDYSGHRK